MDVEADYNIAPPSYDEVRKQKSIYKSELRHNLIYLLRLFYVRDAFFISHRL